MNDRSRFDVHVEHQPLLRGGSRVPLQTPRPLSDAKAFAWALLLYGCAYLGFFAKSLASGREIAPGDALDFGMSTYLSSTTIWSDSMYSGYPIMADPQALAWYPVFQLMRALGLSWSLFEISGYVLASATAFLLVRRLTQSTPAGAFSGAVFGFSAIMLAHTRHFNQVHAAAWMPLVVYGLHLVRSGRGGVGALVGAGAFALMWLAGHPQVIVYTAYMSAALVAGWLWIDRPSVPDARQRLFWWGLAGVLGLGLAAVVILPAAELGGLSRRAEGSWELYTSGAMSPWQLITFAFPLAFGGFSTRTGMVVNYAGEASLVEMAGYVGLLPLALALAATVERQWLQRRDARLWVGLAAVALLLCLGPATPLAAVFFHLPGYAAFRLPVRHLFIVAFCVSVAGGIGLAGLLGHPRGVRSLAGALVAICGAAAIGMAAFSMSGHPAWAPLSHNPAYLRWTIDMPLVVGAIILVTAVVAAALLSRGAVSQALVGLLLLTVHVGDMLAHHDILPGNHFSYGDTRPAAWTLRPDMATLRDELRTSGGRVLVSDGSHNTLLRLNLTRAWHVPAASGTGSLAIERYADSLTMGGPGDVSGAALSEAQSAVDLFAVQYLLVPAADPVLDDLRRQAGRWQQVRAVEPDYLLFRNARARPRAWCVPEVYPTDETLPVLRTGLLPDGARFDPAHTALVDPGVLPDWANVGHATESRTVATTLPGTNGEYDVTATGGGCLLVLSEVHYPWWRLSIDGQETTPMRINHTMIGAPVAEGRHIVRLWLEPRSVWFGGAVSLTAFIGWMALALGDFRLRRRSGA